MKRVTCIIPAYNEALRIRRVVDVARETAEVTEVIVVNDGSTDDTARILAEYSDIRVIAISPNGGKSNAVARGIQEAQGEYLLFLDADLVGLTPEAVSALINPVIQERADISISLRGNAPGLWKRIGIDYISGERVLPRALVSDAVAEMATLSPFGLEVWLNKRIIERAYRIAVAPWPNVESPFKYKKYGVWAGVYGDLVMMLHIRATVPFYRCLIQIVRMRRARVSTTQ
jgi:glycosyltransferase involved in cell wall biosynthesis